MKILVVDDSEDVAKFIRICLNRSGYEDVESFTDPLEALEAAVGGNGLDLLISDFSMPEMNGLELIEKVKKSWPDSRAILATGRKREKGWDMSQCNGFLRKPFNRKELINIVRTVVPDRKKKGGDR